MNLAGLHKIDELQASSNVHLFVEILNRYLFYFEADNDKVRLVSHTNLGSSHTQIHE